MTLKELFSDWTDGDVAEYYLACLFGIMPYDGTKPNEWSATFDEVKGIFNTNNPFENTMCKVLFALREGGLLEENEDSQYRWNESFEQNRLYQPFLQI